MRRLTADEKKLTAGLVTLAFNGIVIIAVLLLFFNMAFGWFASKNNDAAGNTGISANDLQYPVINAWRYDLDDETTGESFDKTGTWVSAIDTSVPNDRSIVSVEYNQYAQGETGEAFTFRSVHLGTVDNLLSLSDDNAFYIRVDIMDPEGYYEKARIGYTLADSGVHFYDLDGNDSTAELTTEQKHGLAEIFTVEYAVSDQAYDPINSKSSLEGLFDGTTVLQNNAALTSLGTHTDPYYVYFRFSPDLNKCFEATDTLSVYMPCEILYDLMIQFDFTR